MIPATRVDWFARLFAGHARTRLFRTFGRIRIAGLERLEAAVAGGPVLVIANHTTWWDPLIAVWLAHGVLRADAFAMMDASNLRRLPFFGKVGAFGVDLADRRDGARAIRYAAGLLDRPRRLVWIYPEGRERSPFAKLELRPGAASIARISKASVVPVATRYVFAGEEKPELWIAIGEPRSAASDFEAVLGEELARIDRALESGSEAGFTLLHRAEPGWLARLAERMLAVMTRLF